MVNASANPACESLARVIARLSAEIQRLMRDIPLRQGRLQELETRQEQSEGAIEGITEEIRAALDELQNAENDIVQMEIFFRMNCHRGTA